MGAGRIRKSSMSYGTRVQNPTRRGAHRASWGSRRARPPRRGSPSSRRGARGVGSAAWSIARLPPPTTRELPGGVRSGGVRSGWAEAAAKRRRSAAPMRRERRTPEWGAGLSRLRARTRWRPARPCASSRRTRRPLGSSRSRSARARCARRRSRSARLRPGRCIAGRCAPRRAGGWRRSRGAWSRARSWAGTGRGNGAEEKGFEPLGPMRPNGFQDRRLRPLGHSSTLYPTWFLPLTGTVTTMCVGCYVAVGRLSPLCHWSVDDRPPGVSSHRRSVRSASSH